MRIGVVSDTHNHLSNTAHIVELFNAAQVDRVVHTGDITQAKTLRVMAALDAPLVGAYGNNDLERESLESACAELGMDFVDHPLHIEWQERRVVVVHDPRDLAPELLAGCEIALHGHDHWQKIERHHGALVFNPGECAGHMQGRNSVGVLDLTTLRAQILNF
jgi:putative phosphoesterase